MRYLAGFGNLWCLVGALLLVFLLLVAAALLSRSRAQTRATRRLAPPRTAPIRSREITASAPFEALAALRERLIELQRHLPPGSEDARWLAGYVHDLHNVMDDMYWELYQAEGATRGRLLERLSVEVGRLDQTIRAHLSTAINEATDREALHTQLERLRHTLSGE